MSHGEFVDFTTKQPASSWVQTETAKSVFFWHAPSLGNWSICPFTITYLGHTANVNCSEQAMMWCKAILFKDMVAATKILAAKDPKKQKALGRTVRGFVQDVWDKEALPVMVHLLTAKFEQNEDYAQGLLATGDKLLVEASPLDPLYGVKMTAQQCIASGEDPCKWKGKNWLGIALMRVRAHLGGAAVEDVIAAKK